MNARLHLAGAYRRTVDASLDRIWENVFDWEHLHHLHDGSFAACVLVEEGAWGWRVALNVAGRSEPQLIELRADRAAGRYVSTTLTGAGAGTEIRVALKRMGAHRTAVEVEFHLPEPRPDRLDALGAAYATAYARLWDEDEAMMRQRETALRPRADSVRADICLGAEADVRARLPMAFTFGGRPFRLVDLDGELIAHSAVCPHWLGPLADAPVVDGQVRCPWHGYRFALATGACLDRPGLALARAPKIALVGSSLWALA